MATVIPNKLMKETKRVLIIKIQELESILSLNRNQFKLEKALMAKAETELARAKEQFSEILKESEIYKKEANQFMEQRDALSTEVMRLREILKTNGISADDTIHNVFAFNESRAFGYAFLVLQLLSLIGIILIAAR